MRLRKKPWGDCEMETNKNFVEEPKSYKGKWNTYFGNDNPIHVEIGTGKGQFVTSMSIRETNINYIGIEKQTNVIVSALKKARLKQTGSNLALFIADVKELLEFFDVGEIDRIYINFCDPWPNKKKWGKRRLTHENFLDLYRELFGLGGEIFFKTDNTFLFEFSLNEMCKKNLLLKNISLDLHNSDFEGNIKTEYEEKFSNKGMPIYRLEAYFK